MSGFFLINKVPFQYWFDGGWGRERSINQPIAYQPNSYEVPTTPEVKISTWMVDHKANTIDTLKIKRPFKLSALTNEFFVGKKWIHIDHSSSIGPPMWSLPWKHPTGGSKRNPTYDDHGKGIRGNVLGCCAPLYTLFVSYALFWWYM